MHLPSFFVTHLQQKQCFPPSVAWVENKQLQNLYLVDKPQESYTTYGTDCTDTLTITEAQWRHHLVMGNSLEKSDWHCFLRVPSASACSLLVGLCKGLKGAKMRPCTQQNTTLRVPVCSAFIYFPKHKLIPNTKCLDACKVGLIKCL